jgi:hypothetical protein
MWSVLTNISGQGVEDYPIIAPVTASTGDGEFYKRSRLIQGEPQ